jgi:hypothetical protein
MPKIGIYSFHTWEPGSPQITPRLRTEFADREPIWGWHAHTVPLMERQIDYAADAGIAFWAFDWYWREQVSPDQWYHTGPRPDDLFLNNGLKLYLQASNRQRMEFCLLVANHKPFRVGPDDWEDVIATWLPLLTHPQHLRIDGKPLLIIFSPPAMDERFGSDQAVAAAWERLQAAAREAGLPGVAIAGCEGGTLADPNFASRLARRRDQGYTHFTGYNYRPPGPAVYEEHSFTEIVDYSPKVWDAFAAVSPLPYLPCITIGWDPRPWQGPDGLGPDSHVCWHFTGRTPELVAKTVADAVAWMRQHPDIVTSDEIAVMYAWDENGEGGYLMPTVGDGNAYLEALRPILTGQA